MSKKTAAYDESSFRVLKGLEPVRERPGMYTRTDSPMHIIQDLIDHAADEFLAIEPPPTESMFDYVWGEMPPEFAKQRMQAMSDWGRDA